MLTNKIQMLDALETFKSNSETFNQIKSKQNDEEEKNE